MNKHRRHPPGSNAEALAIALPMIISQSADTLMLFTDRWFLARVSDAHFSATFSGGLMSFTVGVLFFGIISQLNALVGHYYGAGRHDRCALATSQAVIFACLAYPLVLFPGIPIGEFLFRAAGHDPTQLVLEQSYFRILSYGMILQFLRVVFSCFFAGIGRTRLVMVAQVTSVVLNIPLSWALVFGHCGAPAMGLPGAAYATIIASGVGLVVLVAGYLRPANLVQFAIRESFRFDPADFRRLLRFGLPSGLEQLLNLGAFNQFVLMMHAYGAGVAAAITIQFSWNLVAFLPVIGLQIAAISLVGQHLGAGNPENARRSTMATLRLAMIFTGTIVVIYLTFTEPLIHVFSKAAADPEVAHLAKVLIRMSCLYLVFDAAYLVYGGALKGAGDTVWSMAVSASMHWLLVAIAWYMRNRLHSTPVQIWTVYVATILIIGAAFAIRFHRGRWQSIRMIETPPSDKG